MSVLFLCKKLLSRSVRLYVVISRRNACWGNFLEVCFSTLGTSQKLLKKSALQCIPLGPKLLHQITLLLKIDFPDYVYKFYRLGFALVHRLCNFLRCCIAHHVDIGLRYIIVSEFLSLLCTLFLHHSMQCFRPQWYGSSLSYFGDQYRRRK